MLPDFRLAGTPDGLIEWPDQSETVLEVKSHGTAQNYDNCPSEMHVRQTELNIELFHEVTAHRPEDGIIIYGLAGDYGRLTLHRVERRPTAIAAELRVAPSRSCSRVVSDLGLPPTKKICLRRKLEIAVCRRSNGRPVIHHRDGSDMEFPASFLNCTTGLPRLRNPGTIDQDRTEKTGRFELQRPAAAETLLACGEIVARWLLPIAHVRKLCCMRLGLSMVVGESRNLAVPEEVAYRLF